MKKISLLVLLLCLVMIGLLPRNSGKKIPAHLPNFVSEAVSANSEFVIMDQDQAVLVSAKDLAAGESTFERLCNECHSAPLVFKSGTLAGQVDSLAGAMFHKDVIEVSDTELRQLVLFLKSRLPRQ